MAATPAPKLWPGAGVGVQGLGFCVRVCVCKFYTQYRGHQHSSNNEEVL